MSGHDQPFARIDRDLRARAQARPDPANYLRWIDAHAQVGSFDRAETIARDGIVRNPGNDSLLVRYALLQREADKRDDSAAILDHLLARAPADADAAYLRALVELERGGDAVALFDRASFLRMDRHAVLGKAAALGAQGHPGRAIDLLQSHLCGGDYWPEGLAAAARLLWEGGERSAALRLFDVAIRALPELPRFMRKGGFLAAAEDWEGVLGVCAAARRALPDGGGALTAMLAAQALDELGMRAAADRVFAELAAVDDPGFAPIRARAMLRREQHRELDVLFDRHRGSPCEALLWPYRAIQWQRSDPDRYARLTGNGRFVAAHRLDLSATDLARICDKIRSLHAQHAAPHDQSARGGSQTHGNLFDRTDPETVLLRQAVRGAVDAYIAALPPVQADHPLLSRPRRAYRFAGSWSVRLRPGGHHVPHVHPMGWISSALHLDLPGGGEERAEGGHFFIDRPPASLARPGELGRTMAPAVGTVILFPSYLWHGTVPFDSGERLTVAFDLAAYPTVPG